MRASRVREVAAPVETYKILHRRPGLERAVEQRINLAPDQLELRLDLSLDPIETSMEVAPQEA